MRRSKTMQINALLQLFIKEFKLEKGLLENRTLNLWDEVMGNMVAKATRLKYIKDGKLYVYLSSSVIRHELFMMRTEIVKEINRRVGQDIINDLILK
ncbi:MAG: DUF721 domain-containing protein [Prevotellaceae bacterium]|jgi:predicted nucleic acid-binding Zn ribbon protein|nr:DUF721 domain-containing protein [Prevotellaceae bacterium]